jgi:uncharacterized membrane protein YeaQ/YmgE (transglycosylase-associated protein family)
MVIAQLFAFLGVSLFLAVLARLITTGPDPMHFGLALMLGCLGAVAGGFISSWALGFAGPNYEPVSVIGAVLASSALLMVARWLKLGNPPRRVCPKPKRMHGRF